MEKTLRTLCKTKTTLRDEDIDILEDIEKHLPLIAGLISKDIFIDCISKDNRCAVVVSECKPDLTDSLYKGSVVGDKAFMENEPAVIRTLLTGMPSIDLKAVTQEKRTVRQTAIPIKNMDAIIGTLISETDITDKLRQSRQFEILEEANKSLTQVFMNLDDNTVRITEHILDAVIIFDKNNRAMYANQEARHLYKQLGYLDEITGMSLDNVRLNDNIDESGVLEKEVSIGELIIRIKYVFLHGDGNIKLIMILRDISEIRAKEKELILRSVAIKELHHRVKNSLQSIAALLRVQVRRSHSDEVKKVLNENISRILGLATTYEILLSNGMEDVDMIELLRKTKDNAFRFLIPFNKSINADIEGDSLLVDSETGTSVAQVVNELLSNSLKHAFIGRDTGHIKITLSKNAENTYIRVNDDGIGFDQHQKNKDSIGLTLVNAIVKDKLKGTIEISSGSMGTQVEFSF